MIPPLFQVVPVFLVAILAAFFLGAIAAGLGARWRVRYWRELYERTHGRLLLERNQAANTHPPPPPAA